LADLKISEATLISSASGVLQGTDRFPFARQSSSTAYSVNLAFIYSTMMDWLDGIASNPLDGTAGDEPKAIYFRAGDAFSGTEGDGAGITIRAGAADGDGGGGPITILAGNAGGELAAGALDLQGGTGAGTASSEISLPGGQPIGDVTPTLTIQGGNAHNATNNAGTSIEIIAGSGDGTGVGGHAWFYSNPISTGTSGEAAVFSGNTTISGDTGVASIGSGSAEGSGGDSGAVVVYTGDSVAADTGAISITTGTAAHFSGDATIVTGPGNTKSGNTFLQTGKSDSGDSGNITIQTGTAGGTRGSIVFDGPISAAGGDYVTANSGTLPDMAHQTIVVTDATNLPGQSYSLTLGKLYADFFGEWYFNNPMDAASGSGDNGMGVYIDAGVGDGAGEGGRIQLTTGGTTGSGNSGPIFFRTAYPLDTAANSGQIGIGTGGANAGNSGAINIATGDTSSTGSSGFIDVKTGASSTGDSSRLQLRTGEAGTNSGQINILSGNAQAVAGDIQIVAGDSGPDFQGGGMYVLAGNGEGSGQGGFTQVSSGTGGDTGSGGNFQLSAGQGGTSSGNGGAVTISSGAAPAGDSGTITLQAGTASGTRGNVSAVAREISLVADEKIILDAGYLICPVGNNFLELGTEGTGGVDVFTGSLTGDQVSGGTNISTGNTENAHTGGLQIFSGSASGAGYNSGSIGIYTGNPGEGGTRGKIVLDALRVLLVGAPTSDPHDAGALWVDTSADNVVKCSAG
jgi:hypothetical protein